MDSQPGIADAEWHALLQRQQCRRRQRADRDRGKRADFHSNGLRQHKQFEHRQRTVGQHTGDNHRLKPWHQQQRRPLDQLQRLEYDRQLGQRHQGAPHGDCRWAEPPVRRSQPELDGNHNGLCQQRNQLRRQRHGHGQHRCNCHHRRGHRHHHQQHHRPECQQLRFHASRWHTDHQQGAPHRYC